MLAFEILVNGKKLCVAGTEISDVLSMGISWVRREDGLVRFDVGGIIAGKHSDHFHWRTPALAIGDEVTIRLVDADACDKPDVIYQPATQRPCT